MGIVCAACVTAARTRLLFTRPTIIRQDSLPKIYKF